MFIHIILFLNLYSISKFHLNFHIKIGHNLQRFDRGSSSIWRESGCSLLFITHWHNTQKIMDRNSDWE